MLIYMAPCGIGLGHASRTVAIAYALKRRGHEVVFSTYGEAVGYVRKHGFKVLGTFELEYVQDEKGGLDLRQTIAQGPKAIYRFIRQVGAELYYTGILNPDVIVSDSRLSSSIAALARGIPSILIINQLLIIIPISEKTREEYKIKAKSIAEKVILEFMANIWRRSEKILIPDFPPPYTISKKNLVLSEDLCDKMVFIGPLISKYPEELPDKNELRKQLGLPMDKTIVLVCPSGTRKEKRALSSAIVDIVRRINYEDIFFIISRGDVFAESEFHMGKNYIVYGWLKDKFMYLKAADIVVAHGGHTTIAEAMYYGKPMILIPTTGHTERLSNSESVCEMGIGEIIRQEELTVETFSNTLSKILKSDNYFISSRRIMKEIGNFRGHEEAAKIIEGLAR